MRLTQLQVEERMYQEGRERVMARLQEAEAKGRASSNPYALKIMTEFVEPLRLRIDEAITSTGAARRRAHVQLLAPLDALVVAGLAVRHVLNACMEREQNTRVLGYSLGRTIHNELVLRQFELGNPELYATLARDFSRRRSQDERHRLTVFKQQAKKAGIDIAEWGLGARDQVGLWLLGQLEELGLIEIGEAITVNGAGGRPKTVYPAVTFSQRVIDLLSQIRGYIEVTQPAFGPCVEPPRDWTGLTDGGWHSERMRRLHRYLVKTQPTAREALKHADLSVPLAAINALQRTAWRVNGRVLDVVMELARGKKRHLAEVEIEDRQPKPPKPAAVAIPKAERTPAQEAEVVAWKRAAAKWWEEGKLRSIGFGRFYAATRQAAQFRDCPELFFVYFFDSRGRAYPYTYGMNPQGSDLQKGLLHFAEALPLDTDRAVSHFIANGANLYGVDDVPHEEREQWVRENATMIRNAAAAPLDFMWWTEADSPVQFLAWCFEFCEWEGDPGSFRSRLPANKDGSCNGLQHFSAMLRDEVGGDATNLVPHPKKQDVYRRVAERAQERLRAAPLADAITQAWQAHGIERGLAKRPVMTTPYGVTERAATEYVVSDYLAEGKGPRSIERHDYRKAAQCVMGYVWPAIGEVVVKSRAAMDWLQAGGRKIARSIAKEPDPCITWTTPSGFVATQTYFRSTIKRVSARLHGDIRIKVAVETDSPHTIKHGNGLAPNFVHSMDAAHMHRVIARAAAEGIRSFSMIHDSYGTHPAHTERLAQIIREEFVAIYASHDPLADLAGKYPVMGTPPERGALDLRGVLESEFFFS